MTTKKKLIALALCVVILIATILSGTVAYFTDEHTVSNTFTSGNVKITLDEATVEKNADGDLVATATRTDANQSYGTIYPGMSITKDPTITNVGEEKAYVAAKVVISNTEGRDLTTLFRETSANDVLNNTRTTVVTTKADVEAAITNNAYDYVVYVNNNTTAKTNTLYFFVKVAVAADEKVVLFDTMQIPADWGNAEQTLVQNLKIDVTGYGIQEYGFANGYVAATEAFKSVFTF